MTARRGAGAAVLCALSLGGAVVTHYSAGPYVATLALLWIVMGFERGMESSVSRQMTAGAAAPCGRVRSSPPRFALGSLAEYGWGGTFAVQFQRRRPSANGTAGQPPASRSPSRGLRDTLIPPQVQRLPRGRFFASRARGAPCATSECFLLYQLNLPVAARLRGLGRRGSARGWRGRPVPARPADPRLLGARPHGVPPREHRRLRGPRSTTGSPTSACSRSSSSASPSSPPAGAGSAPDGGAHSSPAAPSTSASGSPSSSRRRSFAIDRWLKPGTPAPRHRAVLQRNHAVQPR